MIQMILKKGCKYDPASLKLIAWTPGDGTGHLGYCISDYFAADGRYLGPDQHDIEPIVERR